MFYNGVKKYNIFTKSTTKKQVCVEKDTKVQNFRKEVKSCQNDMLLQRTIN